MHYCRRDSHATSPTAIYANITQTGRIWVYCSWFWVVLVGFVGFVGGFGWFWVVLLVVLGRFGWFWVVLGGFGWFRVLVTTNIGHIPRQSFFVKRNLKNMLRYSNVASQSGAVEWALDSCARVREFKSCWDERSLFFWICMTSCDQTFTAKSMLKAAILQKQAFPK